MAHIPNIITVIRIILVLPTAWLLHQSRYPEAFALMFAAGASDALDGALARRFDWKSKLGAILDPLADKFLVATVFVIFTYQGHIPLWVAVIALSRDFIILCGAVVYKYLFREIEVVPTFFSKANTATQIVMLLMVMLGLLSFEGASALARTLVDPYCFYLLAALGIGSGIDYIITWSRKAVNESRARRISGAPGGQ
jgi:cardiolipin synthase